VIGSQFTKVSDVAGRLQDVMTGLENFGKKEKRTSYFWQVV
jgi:hypothetical protein